MKNFPLLISLMGAVLLLSTCTEDEDAHGLKINDYLIFGTYYGECRDNCVQIYYLIPEEKELYIANEPAYPVYEADSFPYGMHFTAISQQKYALAKDLIKQIPENLFGETRLLIGEPDVMDQGGIYVETVHRNMMHKFYIDTNKEAIPGYLHDFVDEVLRTVAALEEGEG